MDDEAQHVHDIPVSQLSVHALNPHRAASTRPATKASDLGQHTVPVQPILVRPKNGCYEIIAGMEQYLAALATNTTTVPCRVIAYDDAETLRQLALHYRSHIDDPLQLGHILRELLAMKSWSQAELATAVDMAPGTVRNHLRYVDAFDRRRSHVDPLAGTKALGTDPAADISRLTVAQVRTYLGLPPSISNPWLDAGAPHDAATVAMLKSLKGDKRLNAISQHGWLAKLSRSPADFAASLARLFACVDWLDQNKTIPNAKAYLHSALESDLPEGVLDCLPALTRKGCWWSRLTPAVWDTILEECSELDLDDRAMCGRVRGRVEDLFKGSISPSIERVKSEGRKATSVLNAPDFIRGASCLTTNEKSLLAEFKPEGPADLVLLAKRQTCDRFHSVRTVKGKGEPMPDVRRVCLEILTELREEQWLRSCETMMQTPEAARERVLQMLGATPACQTGVVNGRPASEVLRDHITALSSPVLALVACSLRPTIAYRLMKLWLRIAGGEIAPSEKAVA